MFNIIVLFVTVCVLCLFFLFKDRVVEKFHNGFGQGIRLDEIDIYLINLERNKDRLEAFIEQYVMSDLNSKKFNRLNAVDGKKLNIQEYVSPRAYIEIKETEKTGYRIKHYQLTRGAIGCYLSHMLAYEAIANGENEYGLIFEDDVTIDSKFFQKFNKVLLTIPNDWDMLLCGCHCITCEKLDTYYDTNRFFLLHSYVVKKDAAKRTLAYLKSKLIEQQLDSELSDMVTENLLNIYCLKDWLSKQSGSFSTDIQMPLKVITGINPYMAV